MVPPLCQIRRAIDRISPPHTLSPTFATRLGISAAGTAAEAISRRRNVPVRNDVRPTQSRAAVRCGRCGGASSEYRRRWSRCSEVRRELAEGSRADQPHATRRLTQHMCRHAYSRSTLPSLFSMAFTTSSHWNLKPTADTMPGAIVAARSDGDDEVVHDLSPLLLVYRSGRLEHPHIVPQVPPGLDAATGVESKDVALSPFSFVRLYLPPGGARGDTNKKSKLPVVVYFHGGGFVFGSAASCMFHRFVNDLVAACPVIAVSVDYRLAPEHMLPAAYEDALAALKWALSGADPWLAAHGDLSHVFLAGDSAGGNICHNLSMHPDVRGAGCLKGTVLIHPWFWGKEPVGGEKEHRRSPQKRAAGARSKRKKHLWEFVCPGAADGVDDPRMNPTAPAAPGMERLACERVMVCVAEGDHLRWRGKAYAEAVARAAKCGGQPEVELVESEGVGHVFHLFDPEMEEARRLLGRIAAFVRAK